MLLLEKLLLMLLPAQLLLLRQTQLFTLLQPLHASFGCGTLSELNLSCLVFADCCWVDVSLFGHLQVRLLHRCLVYASPLVLHDCNLLVGCSLRGSQSILLRSRSQHAALEGDIQRRWRQRLTRRRDCSIGVPWSAPLSLLLFLLMQRLDGGREACLQLNR